VTTPGSILVVDDSASKRYIICSWLRRAGYLLIEAQTGTEALQRLSDTPIDLVLLDVRLPDMSGFAVCETIKGDPAHASTPVVHISSSAVEAEDRTQGILRGADAYLIEPIEPEELLATVHAILRYYRGRQHAERIAARLSTLARLTASMNEAKTTNRLLHTAAAATAEIYQSCAFVLAGDLAGWVLATSDGPDLPVVVQPWALRPGLPAPGQSVELSAAQLSLTWWMDGETFRVAAAVARPSRGVVHIGVPSEVTDPGAPVLAMVAQAVAGAFEVQVAYAVEHDLALTLQHSLLPRHLPEVNGVELAKRYLPASENAEIGGDFYEVCELDGELIVAVGDVGGHSLQAATVMAELRHAMRAYLVESQSPAEVLSRLNNLVCRLLPNEIATLCLMSLSPGTGLVRFANAGHPPPLLVDAGSVTRLNEHDPLLGLHSDGMTEHTVTMPPGSTLVLYTDGLVERRDESIDRGIDRLVKVAAHPDADLDAYCDRLVDAAGPAERLDDIALVVVRRH
jgi:CheY-like chemotaxis protein